MFCLRNTETLRLAGVAYFDGCLVDALGFLTVSLPFVDPLSSDSSRKVEGAEETAALSKFLLWCGCKAVIDFAY